MSSTAISTTPRAIASHAVLEAWLNTLDSKNMRRAYRRSIESALVELGNLGTLDAVALTEHRQRWVARLDSKGGSRLSPASVARHLSALRSFLHFARLTGQVQLTNDVIDFSLKSPSATVVKPYQVLTVAESNRLIGVARGNTRDRVLIPLALATGLRAMDLCNLTVDDIGQDDQGDLILRVRQGKGRKDRPVPINDDTAVIIRAYLAMRKLTLGSARDAKEFFFVSRKGKGHGRLSTAHMRRLVIQYVKVAESNKPISPHSLRHSAAIHWLEREVPVPIVQKLLGHASMMTTQRYSDHFGLEDLKAAVNQV